MRQRLISFAQLLGTVALVWMAALLVSPTALIAARGDALGGAIGGSGYTAPAPSLKVVWEPDGTVTPPVAQASTSGPVGGVTTVHVAFPSPDGLVDATVQELLAHEEAGHIADITWGSKAFTDPANPICGDPDPSQPGLPEMLYADFFWPTISGHNGNYDLSVDIHYTTATNPEDPSTYHENSLTLQITVDVENLLITTTTPTNPTPLLWDPNKPETGNLSCNITAAYQDFDTVTATVYDSRQEVVWTEQKSVPLGGSDTLYGEYSEYGEDYVSPAGVYLFQFEVSYDNGLSWIWWLWLPVRGERIGVAQALAPRQGGIALPMCFYSRA